MKMLVGKILGSILNGGNPGNYSVLSTGIRETNPRFISRKVAGPNTCRAGYPRDL